MARVDGSRPRKNKRMLEAQRRDAERWRALVTLVDDSREWRGVYLERGDRRKLALVDGIERVYGPVIDVIRAEVHPDGKDGKVGATRWSLRTWQNAIKTGRGVVQFINLKALEMRK